MVLIASLKLAAKVAELVFVSILVAIYTKALKNPCLHIAIEQERQDQIKWDKNRLMASMLNGNHRAHYLWVWLERSEPLYFNKTQPYRWSRRILPLSKVTNRSERISRMALFPSATKVITSNSVPYPFEILFRWVQIISTISSKWKAIINFNSFTC